MAPGVKHRSTHRHHHQSNHPKSHRMPGHKNTSYGGYGSNSYGPGGNYHKKKYYSSVADGGNSKRLPRPPTATCATQNVQTIWFNHIVPIVILVTVVMLDTIIPVTNQIIIPIIQIIINQENLEK